MKWKTPEILHVAAVAIASFAVHFMAASIKGVGISLVMSSALGLTVFGNAVNLHSMNRTK